MARTTLINFRMDEDLKKNMEQVCNELGMNMTTAFTIFAKKMAREHRIPFEVSYEVPNEETIKAFKEMEEMRKAPNKKLYNSFSEILKEVEAEADV